KSLVSADLYTLSLHDALPILARPWSSVHRNAAERPGDRDQVLHGSHQCSPRQSNRAERSADLLAGPSHDSEPVDHVRPLPDPLGDRKSTRLNSSHDQISYAVF